MELDVLELQRNPNSPINAPVMNYEITWTKYLPEDEGFEVGLKWSEEGIYLYVPDFVFVPDMTNIQCPLFHIALQREIDHYVERNN